MASILTASGLPVPQLLRVFTFGFHAFNLNRMLLRESGDIGTNLVTVKLLLP